MADTCHFCAYALNEGATDGACIPVYRCRRFPPSLTPLHEGGENQFPVVRKINWCGEFTKSQKEADA